MIDQDFDAFVQEFARLAAAFERYKLSPTELRQKADVYFHALKRFPLSEVVAKADTWLMAEKAMPKPVEWATTKVRRPEVLPGPMAPDAAAEWQAAERAGWEGDPCHCRECVEAGVNEKPIRFVPDETPDGRDPKRMIGNRIVTQGRWIHGWDLHRWYHARAQFYNDFYAWIQKVELEKQPPGPKLTPEQRIAKIFEKRPKPEPEPGG